jgi:cbb3-type cytochrome c oxidase subunit III
MMRNVRLKGVVTALRDGVRRGAGWMLLAGVVGLGLWFWSTRVADARLLRADPDAPIADAGLRLSTIAAGRALFARHCAACHGDDARGRRDLGGPDLADRDWLYGSGAVSELEQTIAYGIRSHDPRGWNLAEMPAFGRLQPGSAYKIAPLSPDDIADVVAFLAQRRGEKADAAAAARGLAIFGNRGACYDCHGGDAGGDPAIGAPNLVDRIWLYGDGSPASVATSIAVGRHGVMGAFIGRLSALQIRELAIYVNSLSKGASPPSEVNR